MDDVVRRRTVIVGAAVAATLGALGFWRWRRMPRGVSEFAGLAPGQAVDRWTVIAVHAVHLGAVPIIVANADGSRFQVDVLARDLAGPSGVARTERFDLFIANHGDGATATEEEQGLGAMALAEVVRAHEAKADVPPLLTIGQRASQHPQGAYGVPLG